MTPETLFSKTWNELKEDISDFPGIAFPGVYLLAYSGNDLTGENIRPDQVFYVGMSNSRGGVEQRLYNFQYGIEGEGLHSGGMRFFREYCDQTPYSDFKKRKKFYFAFLSMRCDVRKERRTADDLRKMGMVAKLEYDVLAYLKDRLGREPELNKK